MIISASRRTDIPAYYSAWFFNRLRDGSVCLRNPMNYHQISKVSLSPEVVDGIVFWTKNPLPMLSRLEELEGYSFYFQFTLNAYGRDVEPNIPSKNDVLVPAFRTLSEKVGRQRVVWRYDPIIFSGKYTAEYHAKYFEVLASTLGDYTESCTLSFLDFYRGTERKMASLGIERPNAAKKAALCGKLSETAQKYGIAVGTCAEDTDYSALGVPPRGCIDPKRLECIGGYRLKVPKDKNQRPECLCAESIDIGAYDSCPGGCLYCYANRSGKALTANRASHNPNSPLLIGQIEDGDSIKERDMKSFRTHQCGLFDG